MLVARDVIEHKILWKVNGGNVIVWYDNWTGLGNLYKMCNENDTSFED